MLRIALCDDAPAQRLHMAQMLRKYLCRRPEAAGEVSAFASGQELLDSIEAGGKDYDLYIMDALMPGLTGTDLGVRLGGLGGCPVSWTTLSAPFSRSSLPVCR